ncbi:MAG: TIGR03557 family F420-dependent LLM class oxidoreductase [Candidatus Binatia bacterium]
MAKFGYKLMSEEHGPLALLRNAQRAEQAGFDFVAISDHYHPWLEAQGHSPYAWTVLGAVAAQTSRVGIATAVTCPTQRYHPAIIAQAAATVAVMSGGRFTLGLGAGEQLNEHVARGAWPAPAVRQEMLSEAIDAICLLWKGGMRSYRGRHVLVDRACVFDLPESPPPIAVAAGGRAGAKLAARKGAGLIATEPKAELIEAWRQARGDDGAPKYGEVSLCWAAEEEAAIDTAHELFRWSLTGWKVMAELPNPANFAAASRHIRREDVAKNIACGPDPERHLQSIRRFVDAGFDHVILVGIGPDQEGFIRFWEKELAPRLRSPS